MSAGARGCAMRRTRELSAAARVRVAALAVVGTAVAAALALPVAARGEAPISAVGPIGITVADVERSVAFYSAVLGFEKVADAEVWGGDCERLQGVFGLWMRVVRMRLGDEAIELTEYVAPRGRPIPADSRASDGWFQHIAIVVSDLDRAYARLRAHHVQHAPPAPPDARSNDLAHWQTALVAGYPATTYRLLRGSAWTALSLAVVAPDDSALGFSRAFLARDPDGDALPITER